MIEAEVHGGLLRFDGLGLEAFAPISGGSSRWAIEHLAGVGIEKGLTTMKLTIAFRAVDLKARVKWDGSMSVKQSWGYDDAQREAVERLTVAVQNACSARLHELGHSVSQT